MQEFDFTEECGPRVREDLRQGEEQRASLIGEPEGYDELRLRQTKIGRVASMMSEQMSTMFGLDRLLHGRRRPHTLKTTLDDLEVESPGEATELAGKQLAVTLTDARLLFHGLDDNMLPDGFLAAFELGTLELSSLSVVGGKRLLEVVFPDKSVLSVNCPLFQPVDGFVAMHDGLLAELG